MAELQRTLSYKVLLLITLNSIIGSGMFFLPALGAKVAGPASIISWIIISVISIYSAACFGELVGMYPKSGGVYEYTKQAFGTFSSFMMGWVAWLVGNITTAMLIVGAITYLLPTSGASITLFKIAAAIFWVLILNYLTYRGLKTSAVMLVSFAIVTLAIVVFLIIPGWIDLPSLTHLAFATNLNPANLVPFFIGNSPLSNALLIIVAVFIISEAFFGVESVCFLAGETKNPERVLPKVLIHAMLIIAGLVILLVVTSLLVVPWKVFAGITPLTGEAAARFGTHVTAPFAYLSWLLLGDLGRVFFTLGTYLVIIGAAAGWVVTGPRLILSLAEDKLFPPGLADIHPKHATPYKAIIFQAIVSILFIIVALIGGNSGYERLLQMLVPMVLLMMAVIVLIVPILRKRQPTTARPYKAPFATWGPVLLALFYLGLIIVWIVERAGEAIPILKMTLSFLFLGVPVYLLLTFTYNPDAIIRVTEFFSYLSLWLENFILPKSIRKEILLVFKHLERKRVLDYGAGVGTLTVHLADKVGKEGKVIATDLSAKNLHILERRMRRRGITHVVTIHDPHQVNRVHPEVKEVDLVFSVGMLSYVQDLKKVLRDLRRILPIHGKICLVEYVDYFRILPNPGWLDDHEELQRIFRESGFSVQVTKVRGFLWNYLFIYGEKRGSAERDVPYI